ncbi:glutamine--fructose-6-phosphate aminotransferase [isomerizing] [Planctomycetota bacterium]|nr:glutamine--fructose-6-phosphate aminotransferase [isomerizing] [Planctomycetota bacterium]
MCGIAGYIGPKPADQVLIVALERLKYRGYDSAGMAVVNGELHLRRAAGKLKMLADQIDASPVDGHCGIAHTRWATHGPPTEANCHPHLANGGRFTGAVAVVHNGIIENHDHLRRELIEQGCIFQSETDTEVIPQLLATIYLGDSTAAGDPVATVRAALARLEGSFAIAAIFPDHPDRIIAARQGSPLIVGRSRIKDGRREMLLASDIPALLPHAHEMAILDDGVIVDIRSSGAVFGTFSGVPVDAPFKTIEVTADAVSKGRFDTFMEKEIAEQPEVLARLIESRLRGEALVEPDLGLDLAAVNHIVFLACGTSWHAALNGKRYLETLARVHVEVDISSEYRYRNPVASGGTLVVAISQSGETADTLAGVRLAKAKFIPVIGLVNVVTSTIAREAAGVMPLFAGPEIGVASTKAYTAQLTALYLFAAQAAKAKGLLSPEAERKLVTAVRKLPGQVESTLKNSESAVIEVADLFAAASDTVFLGRGGEHPTALEGALKLKEIAYVHASGYPAGEFKHGPIAQVTAKLPVICLCPRDQLREKMLSNIQEVKARAGRIIGVGQADDRELRDLADLVLPVARPDDELLQPILSILPLQRYAYHVAVRRKCDVDQPRNLAKSVTVE